MKKANGSHKNTPMGYFSDEGKVRLSITVSTKLHQRMEEIRDRVSLKTGSPVTLNGVIVRLLDVGADGAMEELK